MDPTLTIGRVLATGLTMTFLIAGCSSRTDETTKGAPVDLDASRQEAALVAFNVVYDVLQHPRCMNCHPAGDRPLQSDESVPHAQNVQRGPDDRGRVGMRCTTCHGASNPDIPHLPPGVSTGWRLAPREMVFEGLSRRELAQMLMDPGRSHMTPGQLTAHVMLDPLVKWGWDPGPGRTPVPTPHHEFVTAFTEWIEAGAPVPQEDRK